MPHAVEKSGYAARKDQMVGPNGLARSACDLARRPTKVPNPAPGIYSANDCAYQGTGVSEV
jgi:hypothetical protein